MDEDLREQLLRRETALARRNPAGIEGGLAGLIDDDFLEFGASGRTWDAAAILDLLASQPPDRRIRVEAFEIHRLAEDVVLATYRIGPPWPSNRCSVWVRRHGRWLIRFHQGTPRPADA
jgi:glyoxylase I family protein